MKRVLTAVVVVVVGVRATAAANRYAPLPPAIAAIEVAPADAERATAAMAALERALRAGRDLSAAEPDARGRAIRAARQALVGLGDAGLVAASRRLEAGEVPPGLVAELLPVIGVAENPAADDVLRLAAGEPNAAERMLAADGLAWGRTHAAVDALVHLAEDPVPGVRSAAERALFAIDTPRAAEARAALPPETTTEAAARRLHGHAARGDTAESLVDLARASWEHGRSPSERLEAAALLVTGRFRVPLDLLLSMVRELGTDPVGATASRLALGAPRFGYDPLLERRIAIQAAWLVRAHPDASDALRTEMLGRLVDWLARPADVDPFDPRPAPEVVLRMVLPDFGASIVEPTVARLVDGRFHDPQEGVFLLTEALPPDGAATALGRVLDATPPAAEPVRVAAVEGLERIGRVGDEALALRLTAASQPDGLKRRTARALYAEPKPFALDLLGRWLGGDDPVLRETAIETLERRPGIEARRLLAAHLFTDPLHYYQRLHHLVEPADDLAFDVLTRALASPQLGLREAALAALRTVPALWTPHGRALVLGYEPRAEGREARTLELEEWLTARFVLARDTVIPYLRAAWPELVRLAWADRPVRSLQSFRGPDADADVVDLVLEKVGWDGARFNADKDMLIAATTALAGRTGHEDEELDRVWRALLEQDDLDVAMSAVRSLAFPGRGDLTAPLLGVLARVRGDTNESSGVSDVQSVLDALEFQPEPPVESALVALLLDPHVEPSLRTEAGQRLVGRVSEKGRETLVAWLLDKDAPSADLGVQRVVARAVGTGSGPTVPTRFVKALEAGVESWLGDPAHLDPDALYEPDDAPRAALLTRVVAFSGDDDAIARAAALLFRPGFAVYAWRTVDRGSATLAPADASAATAYGPEVNARRHRGERAYSVFPDEAIGILNALAVVPDDRLDAAVARAIGDGSDLVSFPDLYLDVAVAVLHDLKEGDHPKTAARLEALAWRLAPVGGAADFGLAYESAGRNVESGRFAEAAADEARAVGILARRDYDDDRGWPWRREHARLVAMRAAADAAAGRIDDARRGFDAARALSPYDPAVLGTIADLLARLRLDLDVALADALRATTLERRMNRLGEASTENGWVLARVRLARGEVREAADLLDVLHQKNRTDARTASGIELDYARALARSGYESDAAAALTRALVENPALAENAAGCEAFATWRTDGRLKRITDAAQREREARSIDD